MHLGMTDSQSSTDVEGIVYLQGVLFADTHRLLELIEYKERQQFYTGQQMMNPAH
jgi:hypothetical protein